LPLTPDDGRPSRQDLNAFQLIRANFDDFDGADFDPLSQATKQLRKRFPVHEVDSRP